MVMTTLELMYSSDWLMVRVSSSMDVLLLMLMTGCDDDAGEGRDDADSLERVCFSEVGYKREPMCILVELALCFGTKLSQLGREFEYVKAF